MWVAAQEEVGGAPIQLRTIQVCSKDLASALGSTATCSYDPLSAENAAVARLDVLSLCLHRLWIAFYQLDGVCRQSISDSWLGNLRECLAHLV